MGRIHFHISLLHLPGLRMEYKTWMCVVCGFIYDESSGRPDEGIAPGTRWRGSSGELDLPGMWRAQGRFRNAGDLTLADAPLAASLGFSTRRMLEDMMKMRWFATLFCDRDGIQCARGQRSGDERDPGLRPGA
jgi:rubredoxin